MFALKKFQADQSGSITADWVVLTSAVVGISFVVVATVFRFLGAAENIINSLMKSAIN